MNETARAGFERLEALFYRQQATPPARHGRLRHALELLEDLLREQRNPIVDGLLPGLGAAEIRAQMRDLGLDAPDDLLTWFGWHNGYEQPPTSRYQDWLAPSFRSTGIADLREHYLGMYLKYQIDAQSRDGARWFPILTTGNACVVMMDCGSDPATTGAVAKKNELGLIESTHSVRELADIVEWWCEALAAGLWVYDEIGFHPIYDYNDLDYLPTKLLESEMFV